MVSTATRLSGSCRSNSSRMASLIASQILSGWPSVTDSEVKRREVTAADHYIRGSVVHWRWTSGEAGAIPADPSGSTDRIRSLWRFPSGTEPGGDRVAHSGGEQGFGAERYLHRVRSIGGQDDTGIVGDLERPATIHPVDHEQVTPLAGQL